MVLSFYIYISICLIYLTYKSSYLCLKSIFLWAIYYMYLLSLGYRRGLQWSYLLINFYLSNVFFFVCISLKLIRFLLCFYTSIYIVYLSTDPFIYFLSSYYLYVNIIARKDKCRSLYLCVLALYQTNVSIDYRFTKIFLSICLSYKFIYSFV
jgi:hypothetical protein